MKNEDVYKYFGNCIDALVNIAKEKINEASDKIEKEQRFKQESKESRDNMQDAINRINEVLEYDLTTYEGYSKYMEYLGDLRKRVKNYNNIIKMISGQTAEEMIDDIALQATTVYQESLKKKEVAAKEEKKKETETTTCNRQKHSSEDTCKTNKYVINECEDSCKNTDDDVCPSQLVTDDFYDHVCNIVNKYMTESWIPYSEQYYGGVDEDEAEYVTDELIEFACWLSEQK